MSRATPYLKKPDEQYANLCEELKNNKFYLMQRNGPCVFTIKDEAGNSFRSTLGNPNNCTCSAGNKSCVHVIFCLIKILKLSEDDPLCFQTSFTDNELNSLFDEATKSFNNRPKKLVRKSKQSLENDIGAVDSADDDNENNNFVVRQQLDDSNVDYCPICQDEMLKEQALTWCRTGCGNNMHAKCVQTYVQYNATKKIEPQCPLCRNVILLDYLKKDLRLLVQSKLKTNPIHCVSCHLQVNGLFCRCIECSQGKAYSSVNTDTTITATASTKLHHNPFVKPLPFVNPLLAPSNQTFEIASPQQDDDKALNKKLVDYCQSCFKRISKGHTNHHFIQSDASAKTIDDVTWNVVLNPMNPTPNRVIDQNLLATLQGRDLTIEDYDLLLNLDRSDIDPLPNHVVNSLLEPKLNEKKCWCDATNESSFKLLPCKHTAHESCILELVTSICSDMISIDSMICKHKDCGVCLFLGLSRQTRKRKKRKNQTLSGEKPQSSFGRISEKDFQVQNTLLSPLLDHSSIMSSVAITGQQISINSSKKYDAYNTIDSSMHNENRSTASDSRKPIIYKSNRLSSFKKSLNMLKANSANLSDDLSTMSITGYLPNALRTDNFKKNTQIKQFGENLNLTVINRPPRIPRKLARINHSVNSLSMSNIVISTAYAPVVVLPSIISTDRSDYPT